MNELNKSGMVFIEYLKHHRAHYTEYHNEISFCTLLCGTCEISEYCDKLLEAQTPAISHHTLKRVKEMYPEYFL
jgi:hypothetical protein